MTSEVVENTSESSFGEAQLVRFARLQASSSGCDCRWRKVAEALVRFARLQGPVRAAAMKFGSGDLEARVRELLDPHQRRGLSPAGLAGCLAAFCFFASFAPIAFTFLPKALLRLPGFGERLQRAYVWVCTTRCCSLGRAFTAPPVGSRHRKGVLRARSVGGGRC